MLRAWQKGRTGYPLVDAGMRQLWLTGWMQQSIRMVCAAFLTEYLNIHWIHGERSHLTWLPSSHSISVTNFPSSSVIIEQMEVVLHVSGRSGVPQTVQVVS